MLTQKSRGSSSCSVGPGLSQTRSRGLLSGQSSTEHRRPLVITDQQVPSPVNRDMQSLWHPSGWDSRLHRPPHRPETREREPQFAADDQLDRACHPRCTSLHTVRGERYDKWNLAPRLQYVHTSTRTSPIFPLTSRQLALRLLQYYGQTNNFDHSRPIFCYPDYPDKSSLSGSEDCLEQSSILTRKLVADFQDKQPVRPLHYLLIL